MRARLTSWAVIATGKHLFPFRTEKLSPLAPMVLGEQSPGRVGRRPFLQGVWHRKVPDTFCRFYDPFRSSRTGSSAHSISSNRPRRPSPVGDWTRNPAAASPAPVEREVADERPPQPVERSVERERLSRRARCAATRDGVRERRTRWRRRRRSRVTTETIVGSRCGEYSSASFAHAVGEAWTTSAAASNVAASVAETRRFS